MTTKTDQAITDAARRLVSQMSSIPTEWVEMVINKTENENFSAMPIWGTCFKVDDPCDRRKIEEMMKSIFPDHDDEQGILDFIEEYELGLALEEFLIPPPALTQLGDAANPAPTINPTYDLDELYDAAREAWEDSEDEDFWLCHSNWEKVGNTGILAREVDGHLILAINSAGHDFYEAYWVPLYLALGYSWHEKD